MSSSLDRLRTALADRYVIEREVGQGGMATVYQAEDLRHHRKVAIKVLKPELAASVGVDRFLREIAIEARLEHPLILTLIDSGEADGLLYYVMPYVAGESLRQRLDREGRLSITATLQIMRDVADAAGYAHRQGVVHRDLKPDNVMLAEGHASVMDFGIAKAVGEATGTHPMTTVGVALGTPAYMAPEQAMAEAAVDHRADIYALGVMTYELLAGRAPFVGSTLQQVIAASMTSSPEPIETLRSDTPASVAQVVMACLQKDPARRPVDVDEFLRQLHPGAAEEVGSPTRSFLRRRHWRPMIVVLTVAMLLLLLILPKIRPGMSTAPLNPNMIGIVPFRVSGADPSLGYLREGMLDLLGIKLSGEGGLRASDPRSAIAAWRDAGGTADGDLSLDESVKVAQRLGAGQLLLGGIVGTPLQLTLTATLVGVPDGAVRGEASITGPADSLPSLIDELAARVLAQGVGARGRQLASLASASLPALQAYLEGRSAYRAGRYADAPDYFERALEEDPGFALAAFGNVLAMKWVGPQERMARAFWTGWDARSRLPAREKALLVALAGPGIPGPSSLAFVTQGWDAALEAAPDWALAHYFAGDQVFHFGAMAGVEGWLPLAAAFFARAVELDSNFAAALGHVVESSAVLGDIERTHLISRRYLNLSPGSQLADFIAWRAAVATDDIAALEVLRSRARDMWDQSLMRIISAVQLDGVGVADLDLWTEAFRQQAPVGDPAASADARFWSHSAALNQGRPDDALGYLPLDAKAACRHCSDLLYRNMGSTAAQRRHAVAISDALFWDGDSLVAAAAAREIAAAGRRGTPWYWSDECYLALWRVAHGETLQVAGAIAALRAATAAEADWEVVSGATMCAAVLEAQVAVIEAPDEAAGALARLDSTWQHVPRHAPDRFSDNVTSTSAMANLVITRLKAARGDLAGARAAVVRRPYHWDGGGELLSSFLLEEGRLAQLDGDREAAIQAFQHYIVLRHHPDARLHSLVDTVRMALRTMLAEHGD